MANTDLESGSGKSTRQRVPASERRDALIDAAIIEFAHGGLHGTPVTDIARRVGVAQPYVFTLFATKRDLFVAAVERCFERVTAIFEQVAAEFEPGPGDTEHSLAGALGDTYIGLLRSDRAMLMLQLHAYAACGDDEVVREHVRDAYERLGSRVADLAGWDDAKRNEFLSVGMWLNVQAAISGGDLPDDACAWLEQRRTASDR